MSAYSHAIISDIGHSANVIEDHNAVIDIHRTFAIAVAIGRIAVYAHNHATKRPNKAIRDHTTFVRKGNCCDAFDIDCATLANHLARVVNIGKNRDHICSHSIFIESLKFDRTH